MKSETKLLFGPWLIIDPRQSWDYDRVWSDHRTKLEATKELRRLNAMREEKLILARVT